MTVSGRFTWRISTDWKLTTDSPASSYGVPVLVNVETGAVYGPGDWIVEDGGGIAADLVDALTDGSDESTRAAAARFRGSLVQA